jgi:hypothetical protein
MTAVFKLADEHPLTKAGLRRFYLVETAERGLRLGDVVFEFPFGRVVDTAMACRRDGIVPPGLDLMTVHKEATALRSAYTERGQEGTRERVAIQAGGLAHIRLAFQEEAAVIIAKRR